VLWVEVEWGPVRWVALLEAAWVGLTWVEEGEWG